MAVVSWPHLCGCCNRTTRLQHDPDGEIRDFRCTNCRERNRPCPGREGHQGGVAGLLAFVVIVMAAAYLITTLITCK